MNIKNISGLVKINKSIIFPLDGLCLALYERDRALYDVRKMRLERWRLAMGKRPMFYRFHFDKSENGKKATKNVSSISSSRSLYYKDSGNFDVKVTSFGELLLKI